MARTLRKKDIILVFSSTIFLFGFLPCVLLAYYLSPKKIKNITLLLASLFFYSWSNSNYLFLLLISILINYTTGILMHVLKDKLTFKRLIFIIGIALNFYILFYYKYLDFFLNNINFIFKLHLPLANLVLPIGISFFTFHGLSYIIDVYKGSVDANKNPIDIALYISSFPQLVAGPIIKYIDVSEQLKTRIVTMGTFSLGIERFIIGLSKKILIANILGEVADNIFNSTSLGIDHPTAWLGIICYTLQIYFDFSGYSDMAIGLGHFFGFTFMENFNYPYISKSISDFWRRWHISLSSWFKNYLYIPMGGSRKGNVSLHLFVVFLITGLWHGASWTFLLWGLWHGMFIIIEKMINKKQWYARIPSPFKWMTTIFIIMMGWVLFRSPNMIDAFSYFKILFGFDHLKFIQFSFRYFCDLRVIFSLVIAILSAMPFGSKIAQRYKSSIIFSVAKILIISLLLIINIIFIVNTTYNPFIYFQF